MSFLEIVNCVFTQQKQERQAERIPYEKQY